MEINKNTIRNQDQEKINRRLQKEEEKVKKLFRTEEKKAIENDSLQKSSLSKAPLEQSENMEHPLLTNHTSRFNRMSDALINAQQTFQLPLTNDLLLQLSPSLQLKVQNLLDESMFDPTGTAKIQKFFETLTRLIPLGIALFHGLSSDKHVLDLSRMRLSMINTLREMGELMTEHVEHSTLGGQLISLLSDQSQSSTLCEQLQTILDSTIFHSTHHFADEIDSARAENKSTVSISSNPMSRSIGFLASFLSLIEMFPEKTQTEVIKIIISTQPMMTDDMANMALGPHTDHFAQNLSHLAIDYSQQLGLLSKNPAKASSSIEYATRIFTGLIITASVLGRLEVDRGDGNAMSLEDEGLGQAQREAAEELQLHELPPFSFFALWAPFKDLGGDNRKERKEAEQALSQFMRELLRLVYLLVAIYTGGKKLGKNGVDLLLEENQFQISANLNELIFSLKKLNEKFGVRTGQAFERCMRAQCALREHDFSQFWSQIFHVCQEKSDLKDFLEEVDLMDSFYQTIRTLVSGSGFDTTVVRM